MEVVEEEEPAPSPTKATRGRRTKAADKKKEEE